MHVIPRLDFISINVFTSFEVLCEEPEALKAVLIVLIHYDVTLIKPIYCLNAKDHCRRMGSEINASSQKIDSKNRTILGKEVYSLQTPWMLIY